MKRVEVPRDVVKHAPVERFGFRQLTGAMVGNCLSEYRVKVGGRFSLRVRHGSSCLVPRRP
jgi:hypothetical protein